MASDPQEPTRQPAGGAPERRPSSVPGEPPSGPESMDIKLIRRLVRLMNGGGITELEIDDEKSGLRVRMRRGAEEGAAAPSQVVYQLPGAAPAAAPAAAGAPGPPLAGGVAAGGAPAAGAGLHPITSPLVGTFYRSPSPDSDPYAEVGSRVTAESVVCIVEAMKVMNEIRAEVAGEIVEVLVENGEPVEYGQPLFLVKKG